MTTLYLTRDERTLLAAVSKHLRIDGWLFDHGIARNPAERLNANWMYPRGDGRMLQLRRLNEHGFTDRVPLEVAVDSVTEAVDVAVALGLLPQGMSSAYRAGRESVLGRSRAVGWWLS
jgi:hypothetical protein